LSPQFAATSSHTKKETSGQEMGWWAEAHLPAWHIENHSKKE